jgi:hypothetical protein
MHRLTDHKVNSVRLNLDNDQKPHKGSNTRNVYEGGSARPTERDRIGFADGERPPARGNKVVNSKRRPTSRSRDCERSEEGHQGHLPHGSQTTSKRRKYVRTGQSEPDSTPQDDMYELTLPFTQNAHVLFRVIRRRTLAPAHPKDTAYLRNKEPNQGVQSSMRRTHAPASYPRNQVEDRRENPIVERKALPVQQKEFTSGRSIVAPRCEDLPLGPFHNTVDQVSEADVKSGVETLNDSLDNIIMTVIDEVEDLAEQKRDGSRPPPVPEFSDSKLFNALVQYRTDKVKRGYLLDALLHHRLVLMLDQLFFSGEVVSHTLDPKDVTGLVFRDMTKSGMYYAIFDSPSSLSP